MSTKPKSNFVYGVIVGLVATIVGNFFLVFFQHKYTKTQMSHQLYLDEKKLFLDACNDYLQLFRDWHELMNYYSFEDSTSDSKLIVTSEFDSITAMERYKRWKKEFDYSYGKLLLISEKEFGQMTMQVSTKLHLVLDQVISNDTMSSEFKKELLHHTDYYFFETWLNRAKLEIDQYNTGFF